METRLSLNHDSEHGITIADAVAEGWAFRSSKSRVIPKILGASSPRARASEWQRVKSDPPLSLERLRMLVENANSAAKRGLVLALSHDHYLTIAGGVQNVVGDEQRTLMASGWAFLHVCPNQPLPLLADASHAEDFLLVLSINGETVGVVRISDLIQVIGTCARSGTVVQPIVHHLLGFDPALVAELVNSSCAKEPIVWIHDLFTLCPSVHLLRNDTHFCAAPLARSAVCGICNSGSERGAHIARMDAFFRAIRPKIAAPSHTILRFWEEHGGYLHSGSVVLSPCEVMFHGVRSPRDKSRPLRVAFIGTPNYHKGWDVYEALVRWHVKDSRYDFYHFGSGDTGCPGMTFVPVTVTAEDRTVMARAIYAREMDVVINWSACFESFSFTTQEAIAAGSFVIAREAAGNVWPMVRAFGETRGCALKTEAELQAAFATGEIIDRAENGDRRHGAIKLGRYSTELIEAKSPA